MKKLTLYLAVVLLVLSAAACTDTKADLEKANVLGKTDTVPVDELKAPGTDKAVGYQLEPPAKGEEIAVMTTSLGEIKLRFFPEIAPKAVYSFKKLAAKGYYNGLTFHRIIDNFMAQGGDPTGTGTGGASIWESAFADEFSDKLLNLTGAVAMANNGKNTNGSQFFINCVAPAPLDLSQLQLIYDTYYLPDKEAFHKQFGGTLDMSKMSDAIIKLYEEQGGNFHLDGALNTDKKGHTVFAQVFEGLDVVKEMLKVETDENAKPLETVTIEKIEIVQYQ